MIVHHFSTFPHGGAAIAASRLHRSLLETKTRSRFFYSHDDRSDEAKLSTPGNQWERLETTAPAHSSWFNPLVRQTEKSRFRRITEAYRQHVQYRPSGTETYSLAEQLEGVRLESDTLNADILHLHWIAFMADYPSFFRSIPATQPIVWTLHDMNPFTGGCHFDSGCGRFATGCGSCPQIDNSGPDDVSRFSLLVKQKALAGRPIHVVAPSRWMLLQAQQSPVWPDTTSFTQINYGLDLKVFHPIHRREARRALGLPMDATIVGFGADQLNNPRKGVTYLQTALRQSGSAYKNLEALVFGNGQIDRPAWAVNQIHSLGFVSDAHQQALAYSACDFFVIPSTEDNQPQMGIEAMACGVPVLGFRSGGLAEMITDSVDGILVERLNATALTEAIDWISENEESRRLMSKRARATALRIFDCHQQTQRHLEIYRELSLLQNTTHHRRAA